MDDGTKILWVADRLIAHFGAPTIQSHDPVETLVLTILSQNTNDTNRDRAFASLMKRFGTLEQVQDAPQNDVATAIRIGGLHHQKAASIQRALMRIASVRGRLDLSFLADLSLDESLDWLLALPGVGPKTAGIVLLFSFSRPVFPADTHIRRVMSRLGLVSGRGDPHPRLNELLPSDPILMQRLHLLTIRLGREICHPRNPECSRCPLRGECEWTKAHGPARANRVTSATSRGGTDR
jgi:endonuclease III